MGNTTDDGKRPLIVTTSSESVHVGVGLGASEAGHTSSWQVVEPVVSLLAY